MIEAVLQQQLVADDSVRQVPGIGNLARHDLVDIAPAVRAVLTADVPNEALWPAEQVECLVRRGYNGVFVPGIVTRQPQGVDGLTVGFSAPYREDSMRLRATAIISPSDVVAVRHPFEIAHEAAQRDLSSSPVYATLQEAMDAAWYENLECGVFGSCSLALVTGLPYFHGSSDLDLVVRLASKEQLEGFWRAVNTIATRNNIAVDVEVELPGGWGIKLAELFDSGGSVLAKGFSDVCLFQKDEVFAMDHRFPSN